MILYGALSAIVYLVVPLILFEVLAANGIMTFSQVFKTSIIIFGIIGVVISMLRHLFPKDTLANRLIAFGVTVYSGIFLFYMFGGFTPGVSLGTYAISLGPIEALLGLQLIAWLLLASSGIRALQYLVEAIELRKDKEYSVTVRKPFKLSKIFKVLGTIMSLAMLGYFGTVAYSGYNLGFDIDDNFIYGHDPGPTPLDPSDDTVNLTMSFDVNNPGIYAIYDLYINIAIFTVTSTNTSTLPENIKIGESANSYFGTIHSFSDPPPNNVTVLINPIYNLGFLNTTATLKFQISFSTIYAGILVNLKISISPINWTAKI